MTFEAASSDPPGPPTRVGEVLDGRWRLVALLGGGGMGEVYRAEHLSLGRTVAIKVLRPEFAANNISSMRVLREGRAASRVVHPNIVRVEDFGVDARGLPYLVQEYLEGCDLAAFAAERGGTVGARELLDLLLPALDALAALHDAGILHRDLKPENIFLVREGGGWSPRLLDFGLASITEQLAEEPRITGSRVTLGSPAFMSPEQFRDPRSLTPRSDLWSFGVMLYELLSGVLPFQGVTVGAIAVVVSTEAPVPLGERCPEVPPALSAAVMRCLEKDPAKRPASARQLIEELRATVDGIPVADAREPVVAERSPDATPRDTAVERRPDALDDTVPALERLTTAPRRRWRVAAATTLALVLTVLAAWRLPRRDAGTAPPVAPEVPRSVVNPRAVVTPERVDPPRVEPPVPQPPTTRPEPSVPMAPRSRTPSPSQPAARATGRDAGAPAARVEPPPPSAPTPPAPTPSAVVSVPSPPAPAQTPMGVGLDPDYR